MPVAIPSKLTDLELLDMAKDGDDQAFKQLVERYEGKVAGTVKGMLGDRMEAEDVGQEVFIRFYKSMHKFKGESQLGTYLTRIAINLSLNAIKKEKRGKWISLFQQESREVYQLKEGGISQDQRDTQQFLHYALSKIDERYRAVLVLRFIDGYSTQETADILQIPSGTVLSRLARAQKKLKETLKGWEI